MILTQCVSLHISDMWYAAAALPRSCCCTTADGFLLVRTWGPWTPELERHAGTKPWMCCRKVLIQLYGDFQFHFIAKGNNIHRHKPFHHLFMFMCPRPVCTCWFETKQQHFAKSWCHGPHLALFCSTIAFIWCIYCNGKGNKAKWLTVNALFSLSYTADQELSWKTPWLPTPNAERERKAPGEKHVMEFSPRLFTVCSGQMTFSCSDWSPTQALLPPKKKHRKG